MHWAEMARGQDEHQRKRKEASCGETETWELGLEPGREGPGQQGDGDGFSGGELPLHSLVTLGFLLHSGYPGQRLFR